MKRICAGSARLTTRAAERRRRRSVLLGVITLLVLGIAPAFGHHLPSGLEATLADADHLGALCLTALHLLLQPVSGGFHLLLLAGLVYATLDRAFAWRRARDVLHALDAIPPSPGSVLWIAATKAGLPPERIRVVAGLPNPAFTVGWVRPRVHVAAELGSCLSTAQLVSVLAHERAHLQRRDPLRLSLLRFLGLLLFWLPALRRLTEDLSDEAEVLADDAASAEPLVLASALLALADWGRSPLPDAAVGVHRADLLDRRIRRLAGETPRLTSRLTRGSLAAAVAALLLVWTSAAMVAHPLPDPEGRHAHHCDHRHERAVSHLFCLGLRFPVPVEECPHA